MALGVPARSWRTALLAAAVARGVLSVVALLLVPVLYKQHFVGLVALRPTKEVLLAGGFLLRRGSVGLLALLVAVVPLAVLGVWLFYWLGRAYADEIRSDDGLPKWAQRVLPPKRVKAMCRVLERRGRPVVVLGRLAAFPSTLLAAAAGASGMSPASFMAADALGAVLATAEVLVAGYALGAAYKAAGPWLTGAGVVVLVSVLVLFGRWLRREEAEGT